MNFRASEADCGIWKVKLNGNFEFNGNIFNLTEKNFKNSTAKIFKKSVKIRFSTVSFQFRKKEIEVFKISNFFKIFNGFFFQIQKIGR